MSFLFSSNLIFWFGWVILPIIVEFIPSVGNFFLLIKKHIKLKSNLKEIYQQPITIIVPIYNSAKTLYACLQSINNSNYDKNLIEVMCVDNGSKDNSFDIFQQAQMDFVDLPMYWMKSKQGKSKALNKAIFNSQGKYIINIDSDGILQTNALYNMVRKFELYPEFDCLTGAVLIEPRLIEETPFGFLRFFRKIEFIEYCQAFLAGRNFQSETNNIFTLSGAFSALRKSTLFKTFMYNTDTICEDAHLTFQVKELLKQKVGLCENAVFMVDPIDNINKYYTQRQRWQIGELEVLKMFVLKKMKNPFHIITDGALRTVVLDHTLTFAKFIWIFITLLFMFSNNMMKIVTLSLLLVYGLSVLSSFMYSLNVLQFLDFDTDLQDYYEDNMWYVLFIPIYNLFSYFVRFCGIVNSIERKSSWKTKTFTEEMQDVKVGLLHDFNFVFKVTSLFRKVLEK